MKRRIAQDAGERCGDGGRIAWLHARGDVIEQRVDKDEMELSVRLSPDNWAKFQALEPFFFARSAKNFLIAACGSPDAYASA